MLVTRAAQAVHQGTHSLKKNVKRAKTFNTKIRFEMNKKIGFFITRLYYSSFFVRSCVLLPFFFLLLLFS